MASPDWYLLWSPGTQVWWCPNEAGYTTDVRGAGLYTQADATRIVKESGDFNPSKPRVVAKSLASVLIGFTMSPQSVGSYFYDLLKKEMVK